MPTQAVANLLDQLFSFLEPEKVDAIAKETGFIVRKRTVTANDFLSLLFQFHGNLMDCSLQELCTKLVVEQEISVSRTAIDKKFTPEAVQFLRRLIGELFLTQLQLQPLAHALAEEWPFASIRILDSTAAPVPDHLKARARKTRQTSAKIQYEFDVLTGRFTFFHLDLDNTNDTVMGRKRIPFLDEKELCLQDLGYFHFQAFEEIQQNDSYFLTRFRSDAYLAYPNPFPRHHPNGDVIQSSRFHRIPLAELCRNLAPGEILELEGVYFGRDAHLPARCVLFCQEEHQKEQNLCRIRRRETRSGKKTKPISRDLAGITGYACNLPESVSSAQLVELYRLRWQIELMFKALKSYLEIDHFKLVKQERWLCHLYGTALVFLLSQMVAFQLRNAIWEEEAKEISEMVTVRSIASDVLPKLHGWARQKRKTPRAFVHSITRLLVKTAQKPASIKGTAWTRFQQVRSAPPGGRIPAFSPLPFPLLTETTLVPT